MFLRWLEKRLPDGPTKTITAPPASLRQRRRRTPLVDQRRRQRPRDARRSPFASAASSRSTRSTSTRDPGEVIGLIGTNGAGKSTLLERDRRLTCRAAGTVELLGDDVSNLSAHRRAQAGLGRTFQAATLFPELTVRETVQLALEARGTTSFWAHGAATCRARSRKERAKRAEAAELIDFLGLGRYADRFIAELSTGTRRIVELASVLAVAPRVHLPRRTDRGRRATRSRSVRAAHQTGAAGTRRDARRRRARPAADPVDQRPRLLPRSRRGDRRRAPRRRCATTRASSRRTSAPTNAPSNGATRPA